MSCRDTHQAFIAEKIGNQLRREVDFDSSLLSISQLKIDIKALVQDVDYLDYETKGSKFGRDKHFKHWKKSNERANSCYADLDKMEVSSLDSV